MEATIPTVPQPAEPVSPPAINSGSGSLTMESIGEKTLSNERSIHDLEQKLDKERLNNITVFGIFASLVTFLSVEIQIFKFIENFWLLIGLASFLVSSLLLFVFSLHLIIRDRLKPRDFFGNPIFWIFLLFLIFSFSIFILNSQGININLQVVSEQ